MSSQGRPGFRPRGQGAIRGQSSNGVTRGQSTPTSASFASSPAATPFASTTAAASPIVADKPVAFNFGVTNGKTNDSTTASPTAGLPNLALSEPPRKKFRFDDDFTVLVGKDAVRFTIHKDVFSYQSNFFLAACGRDFKEKRDKLIRLPEVEPDAFRAYMQWAYRGEVVIPSQEGQALVPPERHQLLLGELFTLANFLGDAGLKNNITDEIAKLLKNGSALSPKLVTHLYNEAPDNCKLRQYVLDWFLFKPTGNWLEDNRSAVPPDFIADVAIAWAKVNGAGGRSKLANPDVT